MSGEQTATANAVVIKKYANRRLYNTATSTYVTLDDLAEMVKKGTDFVVYDAKTGEEITRSVLTQIIFEEEGKGQNLLPIRFLRQLIRFYGDSMLPFSVGLRIYPLPSRLARARVSQFATGCRFALALPQWPVYCSLLFSQFRDWEEVTVMIFHQL